jgi:hypothetical protein
MIVNKTHITTHPTAHLSSCPGHQPIRDAVTGIIRNMALVHSGLPEAKEFLQKLSAIWAHALNNVCLPCYWGGGGGGGGNKKKKNCLKK